MFSIFRNEAVNTTNPGTFSSMAAFMLCQQSLEHLFFSIYSPPNSRLFQVFTRMIKVPDVESQEIIHILWSSSSSDYDKPNHFVLCVDVNSKIFSSLTPIYALCDSIVKPANNVKRKQTTLNFTQAKKVKLSSSSSDNTQHLPLN